jgi:hypothetical protein
MNPSLWLSTYRYHRCGTSRQNAQWHWCQCRDGGPAIAGIAGHHPDFLPPPPSCAVPTRNRYPRLAICGKRCRCNRATTYNGYEDLFYLSTRPRVARKSHLNSEIAPSWTRHFNARRQQRSMQDVLRMEEDVWARSHGEIWQRKLSL